MIVVIVVVAIVVVVDDAVDWMLVVVVRLDKGVVSLPFVDPAPEVEPCVDDWVFDRSVVVVNVTIVDGVTASPIEKSKVYLKYF